MSQTSYGTIQLTDYAIVKKIWTDSNGTHMVGGINNIPINKANSNTYGYNSLMGLNGFSFRYNNVDIIALSTTPSPSLKFYHPPVINNNSPVIELNRVPEVVLNDTGLLLAKGGIEAGEAGTNSFVYLSTNDYPLKNSQASPVINGITINDYTPAAAGTDGRLVDDLAWRQVIGTKFGVDKAGNLYAADAHISGSIYITDSNNSNVYTSTEIDQQIQEASDDTGQLQGAVEQIQSIMGANWINDYGRFRRTRDEEVKNNKLYYTTNSPEYVLTEDTELIEDPTGTYDYTKDYYVPDFQLTEDEQVNFGKQYYEKNGDVYELVDLNYEAYAVYDPEGTEVYVKTLDSSIVSDKTYYEENQGNYEVVTNPIISDIGNYYELKTGTLTFFKDVVGSYTNGQVINSRIYYTNIELNMFEIPWYDWGENIVLIDFQDTIKPVDMASWFRDMRYLININHLDRLDTSNVINMSNMFFNCISLTSIDVSHFNISNVIDMSYMFSYCKLLTNIDVSHFDTSNVVNMAHMFSHCELLANIDVSHFNTSNVTNMSYMFYSCFQLEFLNLLSFDTSNVTVTAYMFANDYNLTTTLNIAKMPTSTNYSRMCANAAKDSGIITLKYISPVTSSDIDALVDTEGEGNVINGGEGEISELIPPVILKPVFELHIHPDEEGWYELLGMTELITDFSEYQTPINPQENSFYELNTSNQSFTLVQGTKEIFTLTEDEEINEDKTYYQLINGNYVVVENPVQQDISNYYELIIVSLPINSELEQYYELQVTEEVTSYLLNHVEETETGVALTASDKRLRLELSSTGGMIIRNATGKIVATYSDNITLGNTNGLYILIGRHFYKTEDTVVDTNKTYYESKDLNSVVTPVGNENPQTEGWYEITEQQLGFYNGAENETAIAYIDKNWLYIDQVRVNHMQINDEWDWTEQFDHNLTLKWIGGNN